ncbi:MAG: hypothetical protein ACO3RE_06675, partial [Ilumatobacteraceae bacterium]
DGDDLVRDLWAGQWDLVFGDRCGYERGRYGLTVIGRDSLAGGDDDNNHNGGGESSGCGFGATSVD